MSKSIIDKTIVIDTNDNNINMAAKVKRIFTTYFAILLSLASIAQKKEYYQFSFGTKGLALKESLHNLISNHKEYSYTASSTDVWDIIKETDKDTLNPENVILIYSGISVNAAQEYNSAKGWSREHVWAKSRGDFGTSKGPGTDVHHLRACNIRVNSIRNNRNFDDCVDCEDVYIDEYNTGSKKDANLYTFTPPKEVKGDVARMLFYMAIRYDGTDGEVDLELTSTLLDKSSKEPLQANLSTLLKWNVEDPVSDWERNKNEIIYTSYQENRNPFIDYPELADFIWGDRVGEAWQAIEEGAEEDVATGAKEIENSNISVYPNPVSEKVFVDGSYSKLELLSVHGKLLYVEKSNTNTVIDLNYFSDGVYFIKITTLSGCVSVHSIVKN